MPVVGSVESGSESVADSLDGFLGNRDPDVIAVRVKHNVF